ncbi:MAG: hypothetical protein SVR81_11340 [Chloroflexota bacterium]|nr:hypothetical protein [Chloroflexota bacterium]
MTETPWFPKKQLNHWSNFTRLILVKLLSSLYFYIPYMTLFFLGRGFNDVQINSRWGIVVFTMFLAEIPAGLLAGRWGRPRAVQAVLLLQFLGELLLLFITDDWLLAAGGRCGHRRARIRFRPGCAGSPDLRCA